MKNLYFFLFAFLFFGLSESFSQTNNGNPSDLTGSSNRRAASVGIIVNVRKAKTGAPTTVPADDLKTRDRKGVRFQILDANGVVVKGGEKRVKYSESDGNVEVDIVGLPAAPKGKGYRLRVIGTDNKTSDVDIK